jgi:hypothetical protein
MNVILFTTNKTTQEENHQPNPYHFGNKGITFLYDNDYGYTNLAHSILQYNYESDTEINPWHRRTRYEINFDNWDIPKELTDWNYIPHISGFGKDWGI